MRTASRRLAVAGLLLASGCAGLPQVVPPRVAEPAPVGVSAATDDAPGRAERVAEALLMAAEAERAQDDAGLVRAASLLERLGATPQTDTDAAAMTRWLASLPGDAAPLRGRALGPAYRSGMLEPGGATQLHQTFLGGRSARIVLRVSKGPALRLVVSDQSNRQVCAVNDDPVTCRWMPLYTQRHRIEIVNTGRDQTEFFIVFD